MKKHAIIKVNLTQYITNKLCLFFKIGDSIRSKSSTEIPVAVHIKEDASDEFAGLNTRKTSQAYINMVKMLRPSETTNGVERRGIKMTSISENMIRATISDCIGDTIELASLIEKFTASAADSKDNATLSDAAKRSVNDLWMKSGVLQFLTDAKALSVSCNDPENAETILSFWSKMTEAKGGSNPEVFMKENSNVFFIDNGSLQDKGVPWSNSLINMIDKFEVMFPNEVGEGQSFDVNHLINFMGGAGVESGKGKQRNFLTDIITLMTDVELIYGVQDLKTFYDEHIKETTTALSDDKMINTVLVEAKRARSLTYLRTFYALQAWVKLMQLTITSLKRSTVMEHFKSSYPSISTTFDIDGLMNDLLSKKTGAKCNELLSDYKDSPLVQVNGESVPTILLHNFDIKSKDSLSYTLGTIKRLVNYLHSLMKNVSLWELYDKGAEIANASNSSYKSVTRDLDHVPVSFVQFGITKGDSIRDLDDLAWTSLLDWGINRFNSSARTLLKYNAHQDDGLVIPYNYGTIDYPEYLRNARRELMQFKGIHPSGYVFSQKNLVLFPVRRRILNYALHNLFIDKFLLDSGPVSLLPVAPTNIVSLVPGLQQDTVHKDVIGSYETKMDSLALEFTHVKPMKEEKVEAVKTLLPQVLGISEKTFSEAGRKNSWMLRKFVDSNNSSNLACAGVTKDPLFVDMINNFYYTPLSYVSGDMSVIYIDFLGISEGDEAAQTKIRVKPINAKRIMTGSDKNEIIAVPGRLVGSALHIDSLVPFPDSKDMSPLNINNA